VHVWQTSNLRRLRLAEEKKKKIELECGPMPNVMAAQPNIGGALCECSASPFPVPRHKVQLTAAVRVPCSHTANIGKSKTWRQSEFCSWQNSAREQEPSEMPLWKIDGRLYRWRPNWQQGRAITFLHLWFCLCTTVLVELLCVECHIHDTVFLCDGTSFAYMF